MPAHVFLLPQAAADLPWPVRVVSVWEVCLPHRLNCERHCVIMSFTTAVARVPGTLLSRSIFRDSSSNIVICGILFVNF